MREFKDINDILDFAIAREQGAFDFYTRLSQNATNYEMSQIFIEFAKEEMGHKAFLMKIKDEGLINVEQETVQDMKIADYIVSEVKPEEELTYPEALKLAMWREKAAHELYKKLASVVNDEKYKNLFETLATEELKHKARFEKEYDDVVLREN